MNSGGGGGGQGGFNAQQTSQQQTQANVQTGIANSVLGNVNQITPQGNLTYTETGGKQVGDNWVPSYTAEQTMSPEQRILYDKQVDLSTRALNAASPLMDRVANTLATPLNFDNAPALRGSGVIDQLPGMTIDAANGLEYEGPSNPDKVRDDAYNALTSRSNIDLGRSRNAEQVKLANQGIAPGSEAYRRATEMQDRAIVDASQQATINAGTIASQDVNNAVSIAGAKTGIAGTKGQLYGQAGNLENLGYSQDLSRRNQSLQETQALRNSSLQDYQSLFGLNGGLTPANFVSTAPGSIPATDITGPAMQQAQLQAQRQQQQQAQSGGMMGSLFGLGGSALGAGAFMI